MKNLVQDGKTIHYANTGSAIASGSVVLVGEKVCVAMVDIAATTGEGTLLAQGVVEVTKKGSLEVTQGDRLYWDADPGEITKTQADGVFAGYAHEAAAGAGTTVKVLLCDPAPQAATVAAVATANADATYGSPEADLINELKAQVNAILVALKAAGLMA
jgi:predicted RecA/RadA family phage recombinase